MFQSDDEPKDWEIEEEKPSEKLKHKWAQEDWEGQPPVHCPRCKESIPAATLTCIFCGAEVYAGKSGFLLNFLSAIKKMFRW